MERYVDKFLNSMKVDGASKCTIKAYGRDLSSFCKFFDGRSVEDLTYSDIRDWANNLEESGLSATTRARNTSSVKSFFRYLVNMGVLIRNPTELLSSPKIEKKQPVVITSEQAVSVLFHAKNDGSNEQTWFRDYTVIAVLLYTGVRREELTNIRISDVDLDLDHILIHGKGNKQRTVYFNDVLHAVLGEYLHVYRSFLKKSVTSDYLFPSMKSDKLSVRQVNNIVDKFLDEAGAKKRGLSVHALRKRFATTLFQKTHDIALTSKMLGHSSPTVTMRYVNMDEDVMRNAAMSITF